MSSKDMLNGKLVPNIITFAIPIALSSMLQQLFNAADTAVVGHFADSRALAAVGTNGEITALLVSVSAGIAVGANVLIARLIGQKRNEKISEAMHTAIAMSVILGVIVGIIGVSVATVVSTAASAGILIYWLCKEAGEYHFSIKKLKLNFNIVKDILIIGLPAGVQMLYFV